MAPSQLLHCSAQLVHTCAHLCTAVHNCAHKDVHSCAEPCTDVHSRCAPLCTVVHSCAPLCTVVQSVHRCAPLRSLRLRGTVRTGPGPPVPTNSHNGCDPTPTVSDLEHRWLLCSASSTVVFSHAQLCTSVHECAHPCPGCAGPCPGCAGPFHRGGGPCPRCAECAHMCIHGHTARTGVHPLREICELWQVAKA